MRLIHYLLLLTLLCGYFAVFAQPIVRPRPQLSPGPKKQNDMGLVGPGRGRSFAPEAPRGQPFHNVIESEQTYNSISKPGEGVVKSDVVKFLIDNRNLAAPKIYFINSRFSNDDSSQYHYYFARRHVEPRVTMDGESFNQMTYFTNDLRAKKFIAGTLQKYDSFYGIQFYPQDAIAEGSVLHAAKVIKAAFAVDAPLKFVGYGSQQSVATVGTDLRRLGIGITSISEIFGDLKYISMNKGTTFGYLKANAKNDDMTAEDIPIFSELPLDLSVVAGVITTVVQDAGSHVNLKSKERGTPNMVSQDQRRLEEDIQRWGGKPIKLIVGATDYKIEESSPEEVHAWATRNNQKPWQKFLTKNSKELKSYDQMASVRTPKDTIPDKFIYGGKAAKLGFLAHKGILGEGSRTQLALGEKRLTPLGFGIPISYYFEFVDANRELKAAINDMIDHEMSMNGKSPLAPSAKIVALGKIQKLFYSGKIPADLARRIEAQVTTMKAEAERVYPGSKLKKVKVRSSANSEDVEDFDGAGLHDSFAAKLKNGIGETNGNCEVVPDTEDDDTAGTVATKQRVEPQTFACALKGVYASLWNKRAVEERSFARIDHHTAGMGIAVNQTYGFRDDTEEVANGVLITRILAAGQVYGYQMSFNDDENLVTNPTPGTQSEIVLATFIGDEAPSYTIAQFARLKPGQPVKTQSIVTPQIYARVIQMAKALERGYCKAVPEYYPNGCDFVTSDFEKPKSLDMEFKIYKNGEVLMKQTREFSGK